MGVLRTRILGGLALSFVALLIAPVAWAADDAAKTDAGRIEALEKSLSNCTLVGQSTISGHGPMKPADDRYELGEVKHVGGEMWMIQARIRYGEHDVTVPLPVPIRWAGDTPMICINNLNVPGLGEYTARVLFYDDHYAGFWTGKDHGGHMYGVIEHGEQKDDATAPAPAK